MTQSQFDQLVEQICSVKVTDAETPLVDLGVDSLHTVALVMAVEERYGVEIDPEVLADPKLTTSALLWHSVQEKLSGDLPADSAR
ncbi:acyl carrier protein [Streptomyces pluripotens]|uniref:Acyl carrier protein n=1 Tax=Streptomyces pluripotens TaxID=1355015 RepID=A0A221NYI0_9ACTN|nr:MULTISPECIES: acyl carrier protein [Streptomyces]ARP70692.1 acyl carrier protein [Streptomyces pluripotens]ASN24954.1 acyl carrier protein [Streptomyces pluripotens]KIE27444.1 acyl carrier protein [Streptomyces sp. MUSC 125]MCH0556612.1 acyl carrier protein [Streptomyces sp. MUM 16J]